MVGVWPGIMDVSMGGMRGCTGRGTGGDTMVLQRVIHEVILGWYMGWYRGSYLGWFEGC